MESGTWTLSPMNGDTEELVDWGLDLWEDKSDSESGNSSSSLPNSAPESSLFDRFVVPPFSILDTRKGYWQDRKKKWYDIIGDMGESRNDTLVTSLEIKYKDLYQRTREHRKELGISFKE